MNRDKIRDSKVLPANSEPRLSLRVHPDPVLRFQAAPVDTFDKYLHLFVKEMLHFMKLHDGIGLAAPQLGVSQRIIVVGVGPAAPIGMANPEVLHASGQEAMVEGCLSLPGVRVNVLRNKSIAVRGLINDGKPVELSVSGLMARVIQHEIDHLNGTLICDYGHAWPTKHEQENSG
jgi:peptide deformylase